MPITVPNWLFRQTVSCCSRLASTASYASRTSLRVKNCCRENSHPDMRLTSQCHAMGNSWQLQLEEIPSSSYFGNGKRENLSSSRYLSMGPIGSAFRLMASCWPRSVLRGCREFGFGKFPEAGSCMRAILPKKTITIGASRHLRRMVKSWRCPSTTGVGGREKSNWLTRRLVRGKHFCLAPAARLFFLRIHGSWHVITGSDAHLGSRLTKSVGAQAGRSLRATNAHSGFSKGIRGDGRR